MYALGKKAWGISDRSGRRYRLHEMRKEWTGALVGPDEYDPKHPQLYPPKVAPDPQALKNPRPDQPEALQVYVGIQLCDNPTLGPFPQATSQVGTVSVETTEIIP